MTDIFSKKKRSWVMSRIKSQNTILETLFLKKASKAFYANGYRYRKNVRTLPGKPDVIFHKQKVAVFIDGDFWHGYNFSKLGKKLPTPFWKNKIETNMARDRRVNRQLRKAGWQVLRFWEHEIEKDADRVISKIVAALDESKPMTMKILKAVDFFSGAGGLTHGLKAAGIDVVAGVDNDASCKETFELNNKGAVFLERDITTYQPSELQRDLKIKRNDDLMVFAGCAPCQFWSIIRTSKEKSKKTKNLILDFQKFVEYFKPGFVIVENVPGISSKKGSPMGQFISSLEGMGYNVTHDVTDMSLYGIPQKRRRFTLLASRVAPISLPTPNGKKLTVRDVLGEKNGFARVKAGTVDMSDFLHSTARLSEKNAERIRMTSKDGGDRSAWQNKKQYQLACYASGEKKFYDTYGRMWWDKPSPTITTKFFSVSNGRFTHPEENRAISLREGATLQTFPKEYKFVGHSFASVAKMIGNAVPPAFAELIGREVVRAASKI